MRQDIERKYLPQFIYGGIDGAITTLAVIAGATGAVLSSSIIIILGFANLIADGFSMGVSNYLSSESQKELSAKSKNKKNHKVFETSAVKRGFATFVSFVAIGLIPLLPFVLGLFISYVEPIKFTLSIIFTGIALIIVGSIKGKIVKKSILGSAIETLAIGSVAAMLAFFVGFFLRNLVG